jgi:maltose alpha-D-glucosyltransferase/alpha-amylase
MSNRKDKEHPLDFSQMNTRIIYPPWLNQAIFYQVYPQSFYDTNGDGIGDIPGIIQKLDYLQWLGINAIWINPCFVSPFQDGGYDVADYYRVAPRYGTNRDLYRLCREAHRRRIKVCLDLVAGHTSIDHSWFRASCRPGRNKYSDRYIWAPKGTSSTDASLSFIRGNCQREGDFLANCFDFQPALNYGFARPAADQPWQQPVDAPEPLETHQELLKIMTYWLGHGADGFRVDMPYSLVKLDPDHKETIKLWRDIVREIRTLYPDIVLIAEWGNPEEAIAAGFDIDFMLHFGLRGYTDLMLSEKSFFRRHGGGNIKNFVKLYLEQAVKVKDEGLISVPSSNHDVKRPCADGRTVNDLKVIFTFLLTWPGVPFIYYGDEVGMRYIPGLASKEGGFGRTGSRTPMQWDDGPNAGFSNADKDKLYLPLDPHQHRPTVKKQESDPGSLLNHVRKLIALRKSSPALQAEGTLIPLPIKNDDRHLAYLRQSDSERFLIVLNPSANPSQVRINGIKSDNLAPKICHGAKARIAGDNIQIYVDGVSYGIFKL